MGLGELCRAGLRGWAVVACWAAGCRLRFRVLAAGAWLVVLGCRGLVEGASRAALQST